MDPHSFNARAEAHRWIGIAEKLLMSHDLVGSKTFAIRARESDPRLEAAEQILAITETLLAAEKPVVGNNGSQQPDYYAILQLVRFVSDTEHIASQYRRLAILLNPNQNRYPYSEQAFQVVNDAWAVLSNPMRKSVYDSELNYMPHQQSNLGFNIDQQHQHQQHNFFEHNQQQQQHLQQHNFLGQQVQPFQQNRIQSPPPSAASQNASYLWPPQSQGQSHHQMQEDLKPQVHLHQQMPLHLKSQPPHMKQEHMQHQVPLQQQLQQKQKEQQLQLEQQKKRQQEEEQRRLQEKQLKFQQEEERRRLQEQQKLQQEQEQRRLQEQQRRLKEQEEETRRLQELQQRRLKEQEEEQLRLQELQQRRLKVQEEEQRRQQEQQQRLKEQEEQQQRLKEQEQRRLQEQEEEQRRVKEQEKEQRWLQEQEEEQMRQQQQKQQQEALRQNANPVQLPSQVNTNNGVTDDEMETEPEPVAEEESDTADESMDDSPTFWTACPYCFYMYEYPKRYVECTLRCDNCRRAFQAVPVPSPPPTIEGQDAYFYCWGFFPVGVSISELQKDNSSKGKKSKWTPFSPLYDASQNHLNECAAPKDNTFVNKSSGPRVSFDDVLAGVSVSSDDSDIEWDKTQKKKLKRMSNDMISDFKARVQILALRARDTINGNDKNKKNSTQGRVGVRTVPVAETSEKIVVSISSKQSGVVAKESGKLDLNVEFDNHVAAGTRGHEDGDDEEDNIEGIGFFEGLDEFLNNLPILSVTNEGNVKA